MKHGNTYQEFHPEGCLISPQSKKKLFCLILKKFLAAKNLTFGKKEFCFSLTK